MSEGVISEEETAAAETSAAPEGFVPFAEPEEAPFISQRDFRPTPYKATIWEIVGEPTLEREFVPLEVSILADETSASDPMFEVFEQGFDARSESFIHGKGSKLSGQDEVKPEETFALHIAELEARWEARLEEEKALAFQEGLRSAETKVADHYDALMQRVKGVTDAIYQQWSGLASRLEKQAVDLSLQVSRKILATTAEIKPEYIITVIKEALTQLGAAKPVRIRVSPDDYEFLMVIGLPLELSEQELGVSYVADEGVKAGCVIETDFGEVDLVLDRMWLEVKDSIYGGKP